MLRLVGREVSKWRSNLADVHRPTPTRNTPSRCSQCRVLSTKPGLHGSKATVSYGSPNTRSRVSGSSLGKSALGARSFHTTPPRRDVFFLAFPALKAHLLGLTRWTLLLLPFVYRYRMWKRYPRLSATLFQIPIFAVCIVLALGLDQSPRTLRWRLLLMSEREEMEWARRRFEECISQDGPLLVPEDDPRVAQIKRVIERLVSALEDIDSPSHIVSAAARQEPQEIPHFVRERETELEFKPSATATSALMPFRPESANPTKVFHTEDWKIYVVDLPKINAFALPTREIFVYTGIINLLEYDSLLAGVLAHEISHVTQRHAVENAGFMNIAAIAFDIIRGISYALTISFPLVTDMAGSFINVLNDYVADRAYSRKLEMEADVVGLTFMAKAGYDPRMALDLWDAMAAVEEDAAAAGRPVSISERLHFLRTHPTSLVRQKNIEKHLPEALKLYAASPFTPRDVATSLKTNEASKDATITPAS